MATDSFNKCFEISRQETIDKLEKMTQHNTFTKVDITQVLANKKKSEQKLLDRLRSKEYRCK